MGFPQSAYKKQRTGSAWSHCGRKRRASSTHAVDGSCASPLRIIPSAQKLGTMLHLTTRWKGHCHGLTPCVLPTRSVGGHLALRYVASHGGQTKPARPTRVSSAQAQAVHRAQSVRGLNEKASLRAV